MIHDFPVADGTLANGVIDYDASKFPACETICVYGVLNATCMEMWGDHSCTGTTPETQGTFLGARRCKNADGTMDFFNENLFQQVGSTLTYRKTSQSVAEAAMVDTNRTFRRLNLVRILVPILAVLLVLCGVGGCCYCKKKGTCCFLKREPAITSATAKSNQPAV